MKTAIISGIGYQVISDRLTLEQLGEIEQKIADKVNKLIIEMGELSPIEARTLSDIWKRESWLTAEKEFGAFEVIPDPDHKAASLASIDKILLSSLVSDEIPAKQVLQNSMDQTKQAIGVE